MKRLILSLVVLASITATADARLAWRSPRQQVIRQRVVRPAYWRLPGQPVRRSINAAKCVGGVCWK